jgi:hypothetical protein
MLRVDTEPLGYARGLELVGRQAPAFMLGSRRVDFAYIAPTFPSDPRDLTPENEEISTPPTCGFLIGIYLFYENWSTETFRKKQSKKWAVWIRATARQDLTPSGSFTITASPFAQISPSADNVMATMTFRSEISFGLPFNSRTLPTGVGFK